MGGYIKLHRIIVTKDIYLKPPLYLRVFERLIIEANHRCKRIDYGKGTKLIKRGERLTSIRQIAEWVGWYERGIFRTPNPKTIAEILNWLIKKEMIEIYNKGNSQETHYNIVNYCIYQAADDNESNSQVTVNGAVRKQQTDTNKNVKNVNNDSINYVDEPPKPPQKPKYSNEVKDTANYLKEKLKTSGVNVLPRDWTLKNYATVARLLKTEGVTPEILRGCVDWLFTDEYWCDKTTDFLVVERQLAKYQLSLSTPKQRRKPKNRFHNFEQSALQMSNEELKAILNKHKDA